MTELSESSPNQLAGRTAAMTASEPSRAGSGRFGSGRFGSGRRGRESLAGWAFITPAVALLVIFLVVPIGLAFYVSLTKWDGLSSPFSGGAKYVGMGNYKQLLTSDALIRQIFMRSVRNNFYFVLFVVPMQTALSLYLAVLLNNRVLKGKSFFRTAFYFPSVTSSVAVTLVFLFLFQGAGAVNRVLSFLGITGPNWTADSRGVFQQILRIFGVNGPPGWAKHPALSLTWWDWIAGPSIAMCVIIILVVWTTSGTFMLMFLAALQNIGEEIEEATDIDGANSWQRFRLVTLPMLKPTVVLVLTLGLISTWQVFDQIYLTGNNPATNTPAYISYSEGFSNQAFGLGAAIAFLVFVLIVVLTAVQRKLIGTGEDD